MDPHDKDHENAIELVDVSTPLVGSGLEGDQIRNTDCVVTMNSPPDPTPNSSTLTTEQGEGFFLWRAMSGLWRVKMLFIFEWGLPNWDLISDFLTGYYYIQAGHVKWGWSIIGLMFGPLVLISLYVLCKNLYKCYHEGCRPGAEMRQKEWWKEKKKFTMLKIFAQVPFVMPFIHGYFLYSLSQQEKTMIECKDTYKKVSAAYDSGSNKSAEETEQDKQEVEKAAGKFVEANAEYNKIMCIFQQIRLFEILGESGPQAATQIAIALRVGYRGSFQIISILTSLASLSIGSTKTLLLYPTAETKRQGQNKKMVSQKHKWLIFIPVMLLCCAPRLLCLGIELAYLKKWSLIFLPVLVIITWIINVYYGKKDPLQTISGVMTNLFAPCILIKDRSNFLKVSNIGTIILQCLSILGITTAIGLEMPWISPTADDPPIIHCYTIASQTLDWPMNSSIPSMARCNKTHCFSLSHKIDGDGFVTHCDGIPPALPLAVVSWGLTFWLLLSIPLTFLLHYLSDPVGLLVASKKTLFHCCPKYRPQIWDEDYSEFTLPVLSIMNTNRDDLRAKMDGRRLDLSLDELITEQLRDEEDEKWWLDNKKMGKFHKLLNQLMAKLLSAWKNKGQILASMQKCFCLPFGSCIQKCNRQRNSEAQDPAPQPQHDMVVPTAAQNQPDKPRPEPDPNTDTSVAPSQDEKELTLRDFLSFGQRINSRVLLKKFDSLGENHRNSESMDWNKADPVYILQINSGDDKTPQERMKICQKMGLLSAAMTWRRIMGEEKMEPVPVDEPLEEALRKGDVEEAETLSGENLHEASRNGHVEVVKRWIQAGGDVDSRDSISETPLHKASSGGHVEVIYALLAAGANKRIKNNQGQTPVDVAGNQDCEHALWYGWTSPYPLHAASANGQVFEVNRLIQAGGEVNQQDQEGRTPLYVASEEGHVEVVKTLVQAGGEVNIQTQTNSRTALHRASRYGHVDVVKCLIQAGGDVNKTDWRGDTPLHYASRCGHVEVITALLAAGADKTFKNKVGETPHDLAREYGRQNCMDALK